MGVEFHEQAPFVGAVCLGLQLWWWEANARTFNWNVASSCSRSASSVCSGGKEARNKQHSKGERRTGKSGNAGKMMPMAALLYID